MSRFASNDRQGYGMTKSEDGLRALMIGGLAGDARAHAALLRSLAPILEAFYRRRCTSGNADIEDLVQETLIAVHTRRITYDPNRPLTAWLFAIARYKMIDHFRKRRETCEIEDLDMILLSEGFESSVSARIDVDRLLDTLPDKQANAIRRTLIDGVAVAEHAASADIGVSDVKVSVHRGIKALAARLMGDR